MFNNTRVKPLGQKCMSVFNPATRVTYDVVFQVVSHPCRTVLSMQNCLRMGFISVNTDNINVVAGRDPALVSLVAKYPQPFNGGEGCFPGRELHLETDNSVPKVQLPPAKPALALRDKTKSALDHLVENDIIAKVTEPTEWVSRMLTFLKPSGEVRVCIDPKPLNRALMRSHYMLPTIEDVLHKLSKARFLTLADTKHAFYHAKLDNDSSYLTTFATP